MLWLRDVFTLSVYAPLNSSRSTAEEINSNLFHCSELGSLIPLTPGFSLLLFTIPLQLCRCWMMDGAECNLLKRSAGMQMAKPITPIISTHLELLFSALFIFVQAERLHYQLPSSPCHLQITPQGTFFESFP